VTSDTPFADPDDEEDRPRLARPQPRLSAPARISRWPIRHAGRGGGDPPLPPLLQAAEAAQDWMAGQHHRTPSARPGAICHHRVVRPRRRHPRRVPPGLGLPAAGFGDRDHLPNLRSDDADRLVGRQPAGHPALAFLHLVAKGTRACLRALDRLEAATEQGRGLVTAVTNGRGCRMPSRRCCARPF
jgi:hypothetical protein